MGYLCVAFTVALVVFGQLVIKWQVDRAGAMPAGVTEKMLFLGGLLFNPWVIAGLVAAFLASVAWMAALTKLPLSHAYLLMGSTFVLVIFASAFLFAEPITLPKLLGAILIATGIVVASQG